MEANVLSESPPPPDISFADELNRSSSVASTLTAENFEDINPCSPNVNQEISTMWTDEKHSLYLEQLEVSFVKKLHQSIGLLQQCSGQNKRDRDSIVMGSTNVNNASDKFTTEPHGCWEEINYNRGDSSSPIKNPWVYRTKRIQLNNHSSSAYKPGNLMLCDTKNHGKVLTSNALDACSHQCSASSLYQDDSHSLTREGTGQNFVDEGNQAKPITKPLVKRSKTAVPD